MLIENVAVRGRFRSAARTLRVILVFVTDTYKFGLLQCRVMRSCKRARYGGILILLTDVMRVPRDEATLDTPTAVEIARAGGQV